MRRDVFQAIADPTRREIIGLIARQSMTPNTIADSFPVSRQAVSKHMRILLECGLVVTNRQGRERYYQVQPEKLKEAADWIDSFRSIWESRFEQLDQVLNNLKTK